MEHTTSHTEHVHTVVIGGGQAGLSAGYHLAKRNIPFVILDGSARVGDAWRSRWDSLRTFTPAKFSGLDGMPFPAPKNSFPTKDAMGDYLESYAQHFQLPVRSGVRVDRLSRQNDRYLVVVGSHRIDADNVIVAMSNYQRPSTPQFASDLDPSIQQIHSINYRNQEQLHPGGLLIVGAGNSGSEIAMESARVRPTWMSGRDTGHIPFRIEGLAGRLVLVRLVLRGVFHRLLTVANAIGRKVRPAILKGGGPLVRVKPKDLAALNVERVPRMVGVQNGRPLLEDGRTLDVNNVIWCTGFHPGFSWIDLPVFAPDGEPLHDRGFVPTSPGLHFLGLEFLYALSSSMIGGVGRDAERIASAIARSTSG